MLLREDMYEGEWKRVFRDGCREVVKRILVIIT